MVDAAAVPRDARQAYYQAFNQSIHLWREEAMTVLSILDRCDRIPGCVRLPPTFQPQVAHLLPADVALFYTLCGGLTLFCQSPYSMVVVPPHRFRRATPAIIPDLSEADIEQVKGNISWDWYIIGEAANGQYVTIDLSSDRLGQCHDSFWDRYPTDVVCIATSFTEFIERMLDSQGKHWYWLQEDFRPLGSPYV